MTRLLLLLAAWLVASPALAAPRRAPVAVTLAQQRDGSWIADYRFRELAGAWMFPRSNPDLDGKPWRQRSWTVETRGVRLERLGRYDALVAAHSMPRHVRVRFTPLAEPLRADYQPALRFSDGSVALFADHFVVAPQADAEAVARLGFDLETLDERPTTLTVRAPGRRILIAGRVARDVAVIGPDNSGTYAYVGALPLIETPALAGLIDPGLPGWVRSELDDFLPRLLALYTARMGKPAAARPTAFVSWSGQARAGTSLSGSVLDGLVVMDVSGRQLGERSALVLDRLRWFFGHETAHFWLGHTIRYENASGAWITEGSADLLSIRALGVLAPGYDMRRELQREVDDCLKINGAKPLSTASERGETRANYACGAVLMLAAEAAERHRDPAADATTFAKRLLDANRADGVVTAADWFAVFAAASGDPGATSRVATYVKEGTRDPAGFVADLFTATGVSFIRDGEKVTLR